MTAHDIDSGETQYDGNMVEIDHGDSQNHEILGVPKNKIVPENAYNNIVGFWEARRQSMVLLNNNTTSIIMYHYF